MTGKLTAVFVNGPTKRDWEYRCNDCGQLRLAPSRDEPPDTCGNCGGNDLTVGRPEELPT